MIRAGLVSLWLAGPVAAEGLVGQALCQAAWMRLSQEASGAFPIQGTLSGMESDWCVVERMVIETGGDYTPDWHIDRLRFRGGAFAWFLAGGEGLADRLELKVEGLRLVVATGNPQADYLFAAQSRPNRINGELAVAWDVKAKSLQLERLRIDFPGENLVEASARASGVDLSSFGAAQISTTSFALTGIEVTVQTHGLFEWYLLPALGASFLPYEGDVAAAAEALKAEMTAGLAELPEASFPAETKAALTALIAELPNPSGDLTLSLRAEPGFGPGRLAGYAMTGVPDNLAEAAPIFAGLRLDIGWTHADTP